MHALHMYDCHVPPLVGLQVPDTWLAFYQLPFSGAGAAPAEEQSGARAANPVIAAALHQPHVAAHAAEPAPAHAAACAEDRHAGASAEAGSAALAAAGVIAAGARAGVRGGAAPEHAHADEPVARADRDVHAASAAARWAGAAAGRQGVAAQGAAGPSTAGEATAADAHAAAATSGSKGTAAACSLLSARTEAGEEAAPAAQPAAAVGGACYVPAVPAAHACPAGTARGFGNSGRGTHGGLAVAASMAGGVAAGAMAAADRPAEVGAGASSHDVPSSARAEPDAPASPARSAADAAAHGSPTGAVPGTRMRCGGEEPAAGAAAVLGVRSGASDPVAAAPVGAAGARAAAAAACAAGASAGARRASSVGTQCCTFSDAAAAGDGRSAAMAEERAPLAKAVSLPAEASVALVFPPMQPAPLIFRAAGAVHGAAQRCTRSGAPSAALPRPVWAQRPRSASRAHAAAAAGGAGGPRRLNSAPAGWGAAAAGAGRPSSAGAAWPAPGPRPRWPASAPPPTPAERERWASPGGILEWVPWGVAPWQMEPVGWRPRSAAGGDHAGPVHAAAARGDPAAEHAPTLLQQGQAAACQPAARGEAPALDRRFSGGPHHAAERALRPARPPQGEGAAEEEAALRALCEELLRPRSAGPPRPAAPREPWRPTQPRAPNLATASRARQAPEPARARAGADGAGASPQREAPPALALSPSAATPRSARARPAHGGAAGPDPAEGPARAASGAPESAGEQRRVQVGRAHGGQPPTVALQPAWEAQEAARGAHEAAARAVATPASLPQVLSRPAALSRHAVFGAFGVRARRCGPCALASCAGTGPCTCVSIALTFGPFFARWQWRPVSNDPELCALLKVITQWLKRGGLPRTEQGALGLQYERWRRRAVATHAPHAGVGGRRARPALGLAVRPDLGWVA